MQYEYLDRIRNTILLSTERKSTNILDGSFRSVYRGRSLEFDDLKEYDYGDDVHDIDWKSSSRTGKTLIRRYVAEKRHNVLLIGDTGPQMLGDTSAGESKQDVAVMVMGIVAYLADRQGLDYSLISSAGGRYSFHPFRSGPDHLENILHDYRNCSSAQGDPLPAVLRKAMETIPRRMIIFVVTDLPGLLSLDQKTLRGVTARNDLLIFCLDDISLFTQGAYDLETRRYLPRIFRRFSHLPRLEETRRRELYENAVRQAVRYHVRVTRISRADDAVRRLAELFAR